MAARIRGLTTDSQIGGQACPMRDVHVPNSSTHLDRSSGKIMIIPRFAWKASLPGVLAVAVASAVVFTSGCSMTNLTSMDHTPLSGAAIQGKVHGGQFPVVGATIGLYVAGSSGYGSSGGNLLTTAVTTAADGSFSITGDYTCPTGSSLVYLMATGGNPGVGSNNSGIVMTTPLGQCANLTSSTFIYVNEVTTAATAIALGQFFTPTFGSSSADSFGTSASNPTGLANAFATVNNLVNTTTGQAVTSATLNGTGTGLTITATPESAKLYTIANILAACVNSDGSGTSPCQTTLFPSVTPAGGAAPTDTLQAAVYMSQNPTSNNANTSATNMAALYGLQAGTAPFVGLGTQPTDWTIGIQYTDSSTTLLPNPYEVAADASGNIWVLNSNGGSSSGGSLVELGPSGGPPVNALTSSTAGLGIATATPRNLAVDTNGNAFVTTSTSSAYVFEYNNSNSPGTVTSLGLSNSSYGLAIDGNNNIFVGHSKASTTVATFTELLGGNLSTPYRIDFPADGSNVYPAYMAFDTSGNLWATSGSISSPPSTTLLVQLSGINTSSCGAPPFASTCTVTSTASQNVFTNVSGGPLSTPFALAAAPGGIWTANLVGNNMTFLSLTGTTVNSETNFSASSPQNAPRFPVVDGAGNVWVTNNGTGTVAEFNSAGTALSPGSGYAHAGLSKSNGITLDPSGNVWIADNVTTAGATNANSVFEIVGAAAPTVTPIALALKNNAIGQKP
jgi:hypothetical protein